MTTPTPAYIERVNLAIDHIVQNLDQRIVLEDVARVACFSPFHFHRVFRTLVGETLKQFVRRVRLERALHTMVHRPDRSLTEIALASGFSTSSDFSRTFKQRYGVPPSVFDADTFRARNRETLDAKAAPYREGHHLTRLVPGENPDGFVVTLRELPARTVAYIRVLDPFREGAVVQAAERLVAWADERGLGNGQWLGYMWEDPEIVAMEDCRYDVALVVDEVQPNGAVGRFEFPPMRVVEVEIRGDIALEQRAIDWMFGTWLPQSGYEPDAQPAFEAWVGRPFAHGYEEFAIRCQLPIKKA